MAKKKKSHDLLDVLMKKHERGESKSYESREGGKKRKDKNRFKR